MEISVSHFSIKLRSEIYSKFPFVKDAAQMQMIQDAFNEYHTRTCIKFVPRSNEQDFISIENSATGCWSSVGRIGRRQVVNFQTPNCMLKIGTVVSSLPLIYDYRYSKKSLFVSFTNSYTPSVSCTNKIALTEINLSTLSGITYPTVSFS